MTNLMYPNRAVDVQLKSGGNPTQTIIAIVYENINGLKTMFL